MDSNLKQQMMIVNNDHSDFVHAKFGLNGLEELGKVKFFSYLIFERLKRLVNFSSRWSRIILKQIQMSKMNGLVLFQHIRQEEKYQSETAIMPTVLNEEKFGIQALISRVGDYLTKPFSLGRSLKMRTNLLERYEVRRSIEILPEAEVIPEYKELAGDVPGGIKSRDLAFIKRVEHLILTQLENEAFHLEDAADHFHLGERHFRQRVTKITGLSPKKYQREIALQKAQELLEGQVYDNLSAVAYSVGIRNVTRFSDYYHHRFGNDPRSHFEQNI